MSRTTTPLKHVARVGYGLGQPPTLSVTGVPILRATNITRGKFTSDGIIYAAIEDLPLDRAPLLREGEILVVRSGAYTGDSAIVTKAWAGCAPGYDLRVSPIDANPGYIAYCLLSKSVLDQIDLTKARAAQPHLNAEDLGDVRVSLPPLDEQRRIADFLDVETARIDQLLDTISESSALLQAKRQSLLMSAFPDRSCLTTRIGYYLKLVTSGPRGWGEFAGSVGTPFFRSANLRRDEIEPNLEDLAVVDPPQSAAAEAARSRIRIGDVLVGITGANTGWVSLADRRIDRANVSQHVCLVRPGKMIDGQWLAYAMSAPQVQELLLGSQYGGTKTQLSLGDIRDLSLPLLALPEQQRIVVSIAEGLSDITAERSLRDRQLALLAERRQALITAAVTGGISV